MEIFTKVNGKTVKQMDSASSWTPTEACMKVNGSMTNSMASELKAGITTKSNTLETSSKERNQDKEDLNLTVGSMKVILLMASSMETANITLLTPVSSTRVSSKTTIWKARVS